MDDQTKQCPQCKGAVSQNAQECPLCGVIFKSYEKAMDTLNKDAISAYENGDLPHSKKLFERLIQSFPDLTDSAQIYLKKIEDRESNHLYEKALSEYEQGNLTDAKILFGDLIQYYPNSPNNDLARKYIKEILLKQIESESPLEQNQDSKEHQQTVTKAAKSEIEKKQDFFTKKMGWKQWLFVLGIFALGTCWAILNNSENTSAPKTKSIPIITQDVKEDAIYQIKGYSKVRDAAIVQKGEDVSLSIIVDYGTSKEYAKELGDNFVRMVKALSEDTFPGKSIGDGIYSYMVGIYYLNKTEVAFGAKHKIATRILW